MGQVDIVINGRTFRLGCDEGEEPHLRLLAAHLQQHVDNLRQRFGAIGDDQLLLLAGLMVGDELWDSREQLLRLENDPRLRQPSPAQPVNAAGSASPAGAARPAAAAAPPTARKKT